MGWVESRELHIFQLEYPDPTQALQKFTTQPNPSSQKKKTLCIVVTSLNFTFELQFFSSNVRNTKKFTIFASTCHMTGCE